MLYSYIAQNECHTCHRSPTIIFAVTTLFRILIAILSIEIALARISKFMALVLDKK
ncbi:MULTISPECIES: hypothetical protein [unclassified Chamaesiphon]|uniref:hypothetical protein n=1 Tax=unclassified Chamaesiphon TaxID=2620921 RepID=UPI00286D65B1|nr:MULTISPECIES: hypothetical protein [unclassified Chamaesiphon]